MGVNGVLVESMGDALKWGKARLVFESIRLSWIWGEDVNKVEKELDKECDGKVAVVVAVDGGGDQKLRYREDVKALREKCL